MSMLGQLIRLGLVPDRDGGFAVEGSLSIAGGLISSLGRGKIIYVDPANGSDNNDGRTPRRAKATIAAGEAALTANQNDILAYMQGATSAYLEEELVWDKDYTHFIGLGAPTHAAQRCRIFNTAGDAYDTAFASKALLKVSAKGCIFNNLYFFQGADKASTYYGSVHVTGGRNLFRNIHFAGLGATASGGNAAHVSSYSLKLDGAEENLFENCTIGVDTVVRGADNAILSLDGSAVRNEFRGCKFVSYSETSTHCIVKVVDTAALDRYLIFKDCLFSNFSVNHAATLAECFEVPASCQTHNIILDGLCMLSGIDEWESNDRGQIWIGAPTGAAATQGIGVEPQT